MACEDNDAREEGQVRASLGQSPELPLKEKGEEGCGVKSEGGGKGGARSSSFGGCPNSRKK